MSDVLTKLAGVLEQRKTADADDSYVASLFAKGLNKILEKVGEEANEAILAAKDYQGTERTKDQLIHETADLWFHTLVMLSYLDLQPEQVLEELENALTYRELLRKHHVRISSQRPRPDRLLALEVQNGFRWNRNLAVTDHLTNRFYAVWNQEARNLGSDLGGALKGFKSAMKDEDPRLHLTRAKRPVKPSKPRPRRLRQNPDRPPEGQRSTDRPFHSPTANVGS